jgi:hypothetical protein
MIASSINEKGVKGCAVLMRLKEKENQINQESDLASVIIEYLHPIKLKFKQKFISSISMIIKMLSSRKPLLWEFIMIP